MLTVLWLQSALAWGTPATRLPVCRGRARSPLWVRLHLPLRQRYDYYPLFLILHCCEVLKGTTQSSSCAPQHQRNHPCVQTLTHTTLTPKLLPSQPFTLSIYSNSFHSPRFYRGTYQPNYLAPPSSTPLGTHPIPPLSPPQYHTVVSQPTIAAP
jgi:hypothetical protein